MPLTDAAVVDTDSDAETHTDRAYEIVREREPINDDHLATALEVGRTPVREVLKRLERDRSNCSFGLNRI